MTTPFRIGTFNLENLDDENPAQLQKRIDVLRPMIERIRADLLFLQEVNSLPALEELLDGTLYQQEQFAIATTRTTAGEPYKKRNLVTVSRHPIAAVHQYRHSLVSPPMWRKVTSVPPETEAKQITWERPVLHCEVSLGGSRILHAINIHLKSKNPRDIPGQKRSMYVWKSHEGWAEGSFLSSVARVGQALEVRRLLEQIFSPDPRSAVIAVGGDFNADIDSVPFKVIVGSIEDTNNPDLRSTALIPCEFHIPKEHRFSLIHRGKGDMLDHVAVSGCLYPFWRGTDIFNELLPDESIAFATDVTYPESDHAPVIATFDLPDDWLP
ncbi:MAG: endonuclease [Methanomicrobiales archaeon]|nr:endonuclease [Methanomicrobiales archaeon]